ncbi:TIGR02391 family protein [Priestia megaterium]|uniref:TIGR02391 family protein n=1 Tax=Priestia megaterium TaxID=1404 RepID=UPI001FB50D31|nr:TIGR02391 family protein [Priestia megaterium]
MEEKLFNGFKLTEELSQIVSHKIIQEQYTDAIKDAFLFLTGYIREISGEDGDGVGLVGKVFGGKTPSVKLSKFQTESEKSVHEGIQSILRGLYQAFRNPRNHDYHSDDRDTCLRIIVVIDTMYKYLKENIQSYSMDDVIDSVLDPFFVCSEVYADSLVSNIPLPNRFEAFITIINEISKDNLDKIKYFIEALYRVFDAELIESAAEFVANKLRGKTPSETEAYLYLLQDDMWKYLPKDVKMRAENMIISELKIGEIYSGLLKHQFGKWAAKFGEHFEMKDDLREAILNRLDKSWYSQDYISRFYLQVLPKLFNDEKDIQEITRGIAYAAMSNKAREFRKELLGVVSEYPQEWKSSMRKSIELRIYEDESYGNSLLEKLK